MTNPVFRHFYAAGWDEPKRWTIPPIDDAENKESYEHILFTRISSQVHVFTA